MDDFFRRRKTVFLILLAAAATVGLIFTLFRADSKVNQDNLNLLRSYGWETPDAPEEILRLTIPQEFDAVYRSYNDVVQAAGFDLAPYKGVKATRYSYRVLNHRDSDSGLIRANVFVTQNGIAAADIRSLALDGFLIPISDTSGQI